ncbi:TetR/AcrR family transcriptional regulator [Streptomyces zagrosensis]|uniref:TetR/AcrR family tetracycline transcriptional repressor n=1 Tax=Streptomyces zagrosensis TaxID=1042984 RepID=A0A7W9V1Q4_9ACTN|nr:TetR/AcrR family transcriptional regulator [Streptomyces zagrosensis]MBB5938491.1 TetR/AcrR family tetracycline transcriptional repressor [Streptomyces zagrosensis]
MNNPSTPARGRPARLDPVRTVETALDLLDEVGLDALTMRRLADAMDVRAGALYRYFATKQDLLTAMAERMLATLPVPARSTAAGDVAPEHGSAFDQGVTGATSAGADWSSQLAALARGMRTALLARRDGARVFAGTHATGANTLGFADTTIGILREAGFADRDAAQALLAVANFTVGHTLEEQAALGSDGDAPAVPERLREAVAGGTYPHLTATLPVLTDSNLAAHFEFGLHLLIQGLRALRQQD